MTESNLVAFPKSMTTREAVEVIVGVDRESVMNFINDLTVEQAAVFALRITAVQKLFADAKSYAYMSLEQRGQMNVIFTDPDTGVRYLFRSRGRKRVVPDYVPFLHSLHEVGVTLLKLAPWLSKGDAFKLATMEDEGGEEVAAIVKEFSEWDSAPATLLELDDKGRIKR